MKAREIRPGVPKEAEEVAATLMAIEAAAEALKVALAGSAVKPKETAEAEGIPMEVMEAVKAEAMEADREVSAALVVEVAAAVEAPTTEAAEVGKGTIKALRPEKTCQLS